MYPIDKYRFIHTGNKTIAISSYAGKTVRGVAKCDPRDPVNAETGKEIASLRCAQKIAKRRAARAGKKLDEAMATLAQAEKYKDAMKRYYEDSLRSQAEISEALDKILLG